LLPQLSNIVIVRFLILTRLLVQNIANSRTEKTKNQEKSQENRENQLLKSQDFSSREKFKNQEFPDQIRRFGNPDAALQAHIWKIRPPSNTADM